MSAIRLQTSVPGPRSQEWMRRRDNAVPRGVSQITPIFVDWAEGALVENVDGNRPIDFAGGIVCLNAGHRAPDVVAALRRRSSVFCTPASW